MPWRRGLVRAVVCMVLQAALLFPIAIELVRLPSERLCACGMKARSCSCSLAYRHCGGKGEPFACSLRAPRAPEGTAPSGSAGSHDRFQPALRQELAVRLAPSGRIADASAPLLSSLSLPPEPPPPRLLSSSVA